MYPFENVQSKEVRMEPMKQFDFVIIRPGGNDTCLISGIVDDPIERKKINDEIMRLYPNVEQVGFINADPQGPELQMAGGEFCGNATRSTAWLSLKGEPGEVQIRASGVANVLRAGILNEEAFAQMPVYPNPESVKPDPELPGNATVELEGITQYIDRRVERIRRLSEPQLKEMAMATIQEKGLDQGPAAGVIYSEFNDGVWNITPVVYVRVIDTLFAETACGSGTVALGLTIAKNENRSVQDLVVVQPTGLPIKVSIDFDGRTFGYAQISGPIGKLAEGTLMMSERFSYAIQRISDINRLEQELTDNGLASLYRDAFGKAPYYEQFTDEEINEIFKAYIERGVLIVTRGNDSVVTGFVAGLPLDEEPRVSEITRPFLASAINPWYFADLGVQENLRRRSMGKTMTRRLLTEMQSDCVVVRTSDNNLISQALFRNVGFQPMAGVFQEVEQERIDGTTRTDRRIFFTIIP